MLLLFLLSIILSFISTCVMSYLAVSIEVTFWVAPVVSLALIMGLLQLVRQKLSKESVVYLLAAGSLGEMIGLSLGFSWPTLYFLHKNIFLTWMESPTAFAGMITLLVLAAGGLAGIVAYILRPYLINGQDLPFPTARLVHNLISQTRCVDNGMMIKGFLLSGIWSSTALFFRGTLQGFWLLQVHTIPTLLSMGFVAGHLVAKPLIIGAFIRFFALHGLKDLFFCNAQSESFVLTFALGMLFVVIGHSLIVLLREFCFWMYHHRLSLSVSIMSHCMRKHYGWLFSFLAMLVCCIILHHWHMTFLQQSYLVFACSVACVIVSFIFARVGVLDLPNFGSFVVVPLGYMFYVSSQMLLIAFVFSTICLGLVINLLFSWKIADIARISFRSILKFQLVGFVVAAVSVGFVIWWYVSVLNFNADTLFSSQALLQEKFITLAAYDLRVLLLGFMCAITLYFVTADVAIVIAGCMMNFSVVGWLVLAGFIAYFTKDREKYYPFCFGIYASHAIWLFVQAMLL